MNNKFAALVLQSEIQITLLIFSSIEVGLKKCKEIFEFEPDEMRSFGKVEYRWAILGEGDKYDEFVLNPKELTSKMPQLVAHWKNYFCAPGGVWAMDLIEVEEGTPYIDFEDTLQEWLNYLEFCVKMEVRDSVY